MVERLGEVEQILEEFESTYSGVASPLSPLELAALPTKLQGP
jgi:hypothetical protein